MSQASTKSVAVISSESVKTIAELFSASSCGCSSWLQQQVSQSSKHAALFVVVLRKKEYVIP
jgi:hypothetical protein